MVPPAKPAASPIRTPKAPSAQARPLAFKALLMKAAKPMPKRAAANPAPAAVRSPERAATTTTTTTTTITTTTHPVKPVVDEDKPKPKTKPTEADILDPTTRITASLAPPMPSAIAGPTEQVTQRARVSLEELVPQVVRRIAWGGDRTKGSVHLELVSGEKVTVHAEGRRVRVEVEGNADLERRIGSRLRAAGIEVESVR
jgi:hypothetical protein